MSDGGLHLEYRKYLPRGHWERIESFTGLGVPDVNYCLNGCEGWIENKLATNSWKPKIRPAQVGWAERRIRAGGRVFTAVRRRTSAGPRRGKATDSLYLYRGEALRSILDEDMRAATRYLLLATDGGPRSWDWEAIASILTSPFPRAH